MAFRFGSDIHRSWVLPLLVVALAIMFPGQLGSQTQDEWEWAQEAYVSTVNALLPMEYGGRYYVLYRATYSSTAATLENHERYFVLELQWSDDVKGGNAYFVTAHVLVPQGKSILGQIVSMHRKDAKLTAQDIQSKIRIKSFDYTEKNCPATGKAFRAFQNLKYGPPTTDLDSFAVVFDPPLYQFRVEALEGSSNIVMYDSTHPLVVWAKQTERELASCSAEHSKQNVRPGSDAFQ